MLSSIIISPSEMRGGLATRAWEEKEEKEEEEEEEEEEEKEGGSLSLPFPLSLSFSLSLCPSLSISLITLARGIFFIACCRLYMSSM